MSSCAVIMAFYVACHCSNQFYIFFTPVQAGGGHATQGKREPSAEMTDACWKQVHAGFQA